MFAALLVLLLLPYLGVAETRSSSFKTIHRKIFWIFILDFLILGWIGGCAPESPYLEIGQIATIFYFAYFLIIIPGLGFLEKVLLTYPVNK
jgi:ubiquinol-cytochrome c reductase cytochrome b subunit